MKNQSFPKEKINTIDVGDTIECLKRLPDNSIDVIFADPPYNMQVEGKLSRVEGTAFEGVEGSLWDEFDSIGEYKEFTRKWLKEAQRVLKKDKSSLWVIGSFQNIYIVGDVLQELGFWIINDIIWSKSNPTPNFLGTKFTNKQETLIWATPSKDTKYTFNYKTMKALNGGKQMTSVWDIPVAAGNERLKGGDGKKLHPTQKPEKLLYNVIVSSTSKDDLIVDPFVGTGTTAAMAKRLGRKFYGIDSDERFARYAKERVAKEKEELDEYTDALLDIKPPVVRFKELVDKGYIDSKERIYFKNTDMFALVATSQEQELLYEGKEYGISRLGGILGGLTGNANGWNVWFVVRDNKKVPISKIRDIYRKKELKFVPFVG